jgi:hypothetical protein
MAVSEFGRLEVFEWVRASRHLTLPRVTLYVALVILYFASTVPVGLFLYSLKTNEGVNVFKAGGYHAYMQCLNKSFPMTQFRLGR